MSDKLRHENTPEYKGRIVRSWLFNLLASVEYYQIIEAEKTDEGDNRVKIVISFGGKK